ncbi:ubiquinol-cytochrome c reductase iron-sulfur subunit [Rudanella lutea]|uniref:QcrA and Rieske domain-containing protein n=1 Tax=Rudanella lutea TaxID=451374 RepID=UPI00037A6239|nr:Rieske 2Fe-2S domain-containing protein [Rudanella lutea]
MNRFQFLKHLGLSGAALLTALAACQTGEVAPVGPVDFEVDLNDPDSLPLARVGGFIVRNGVVVAHTSANTFVAVTHTCSHEGREQVTWRNGEFYCTAHGARFDTGGKGLNKEGQRGLTVYSIEQKGNLLRIHS